MASHGVPHVCSAGLNLLWQHYLTLFYCYLFVQLKRAVVSESTHTNPYKWHSKSGFSMSMTSISTHRKTVWYTVFRCVDILVMLIENPDLLCHTIIMSEPNSFPAKLSHLNFHPLEVVSRQHDPQLEVVKKYSFSFNLRANICKSCCLNTHFIPNNCDLTF